MRIETDLEERAPAAKARRFVKTSHLGNCKESLVAGAKAVLGRAVGRRMERSRGWADNSLLLAPKVEHGLNP